MVNWRETSAATAAAVAGAGVLWVGVVQPAEAVTKRTVDGKRVYEVSVVGSEIPQGSSGRERCNKNKYKQQVYDFIDEAGTYVGVGAEAAGELTFYKMQWKRKTDSTPSVMKCLFTYKEYPRAC